MSFFAQSAVFGGKNTVNFTNTIQFAKDSKEDSRLLMCLFAWPAQALKVKKVRS